MGDDLCLNCVYVSELQCTIKLNFSPNYLAFKNKCVNIRVSHGGEYVFVDGTVCDGVCTYVWVQTFRINILPPCLDLMMKAVCSFEMLVPIYEFNDVTA
jgi:hypothetical protein